MLAISFEKQSGIDESGNLLSFVRKKKFSLIKFQFVCSFFFWGKSKQTLISMPINLEETFPRRRESRARKRVVKSWIFYFATLRRDKVAGNSVVNDDSLQTISNTAKETKSVHWTLNLICDSRGSCREFTCTKRHSPPYVFSWEINWFLWPDPKFQCKLLELSFQSTANRSCQHDATSRLDFSKMKSFLEF